MAKDTGYKAILTDGVKRVRIAGNMKMNAWDDEDTPEAWTPNPTEAKSFSLVPSLYLAWWTRMNAASVIPFTIYGNGDKVVDDSADYRNAVGFLASPRAFFGLAEAALTSYGRGYWSKRKNDYKITKQLQYFVPTSIEPVIEPSGLTGFKRTANSIVTVYKPEDMLYVWGYDEGVEIGPPTKWPLQSALTCAGALDSINAFVKDFMTRGMVKATMVSIDSPIQPDENEKNRMESWLGKYFSKGYQPKLKIFSNKVAFTPVGEGLEAFRGITITETLRYQIHEAMGTLHLLENANYATAKQRDKQFYEQQIIPDARLIADALNRQVLEPNDYHLEIEPERLPCFAPDLAETAQVVANLTTSFGAFVPFDAAIQLAAKMIGRDLTDEEIEIIQKAMAAQQQAAAPAPATAPEAQAAPAATIETEPEEEVADESPDDEAMREEIKKWQRKALKAIGRDVPFDTDLIPAAAQAYIHAGLPACKSDAEVRGVFYEAAALKAPPEGHPFYGNQWVSFSEGTAQSAPRTIGGEKPSLDSPKQVASYLRQGSGEARFTSKNGDRTAVRVQNGAIEIARIGPWQHYVYVAPAERIEEYITGLEERGTPIDEIIEYNEGKSDPALSALAESIQAAVKALAAPDTVPTPPPSMTINLTAQMPQPGEPSVTVNLPAPVVENNVTVQPADVVQAPAPVVNVTNDVKPTPVQVQTPVTVQPAQTQVVIKESKPRRVRVTLPSGATATMEEEGK